MTSSPDDIQTAGQVIFFASCAVILWAVIIGLMIKDRRRFKK